MAQGVAAGAVEVAGEGVSAGAGVLEAGFDAFSESAMGRFLGLSSKAEGATSGGGVGRFFGAMGSGGKGAGGRGSSRGGRGGRSRPADDTHNNDAPSLLERLWQVEASADLFERVKSIAGSLPTYTEGAVVNVFGGKGSNFAGLYYLALAAAWGAVNPSPLFGAPIMVKTYVNRTARHVMAQVSYSIKTSLLGLVAQSASSAGASTSAAILGTAEGSAALNFSKMFLPPPEQVKGDTWNPKLTIMAAAINFLGRATGASDELDLSTDVIEAGRLGAFEKKIITSPSDTLPQGSDYLQLNPSPVLDNLTRDSDYTAIITQALWSPELQNPPDPATNFRYKVKGGQLPTSNLVNKEVQDLMPPAASLTIPPEVVATIGTDQGNQNYTGKPMDPPNKTQ